MMTIFHFSKYCLVQQFPRWKSVLSHYKKLLNLNVAQEILLRLLVNICGVIDSTMIMEAISKQFINNDESSQLTWNAISAWLIIMPRDFLTIRLHVDEHSLSLSLDDMTVGWDIVGELGKLPTSIINLSPRILRLFRWKTGRGILSTLSDNSIIVLLRVMWRVSDFERYSTIEFQTIVAWSVSRK